MAADVEGAWRAELYARHAGHHRRHDPRFIEEVNLAPGQRLLDLGCGVGEVAARLAARFPSAEVVGRDAAADMIDAARRHRLPNLGFEMGRAQDLDAVAAFDVVISTATLHWIPEREHPGVLAAIHRALRPGGRFLAEFGGAGNVCRTIDVLTATAATYTTHVGGVGNPWYFPTADEYASVLAASPFGVHDVEFEVQRREFTRDEFVGWLTSQTLLPWLVRLPERSRAGFTRHAVAAAVAAAEADGEPLAETFVRCVVAAS